MPLLLDVRRVVVDVPGRPHLEHGVEIAGVQAGPRGVLVDVDELDGRAELGFEHDLGHVGVDGRTRPWVDGQRDALSGRCRRVVTGSCRCAPLAVVSAASPSSPALASVRHRSPRRRHLRRTGCHEHQARNRSRVPQAPHAPSRVMCSSPLVVPQPVAPGLRDAIERDRQQDDTYAARHATTHLALRQAVDGLQSERVRIR